MSQLDSTEDTPLLGEHREGADETALVAEETALVVAPEGGGVAQRLSQGWNAVMTFLGGLLRVH